MLNQKSNSNNSVESGENKNLANSIKEDKPMDILFPKYNQYCGNLDILILYKDGTFLKLSGDGITIKFDDTLSMFFKKPHNEEEINALVESIDNTFSYFFNCLDKNNIDEVKNQIVEIYQQDAYYNLLTIKEHINNTLILMQKANVGLNRLTKYYKSYWPKDLNDSALFNIYTNNTNKLNMMIASKYLNEEITDFKYDDGYIEVPLDEDLYNSGISYQYSSDDGDTSSMDYAPVGPTYLTNTQNEAYFINTDVICDQPRYASTHDDGTALIDPQEAIDNGEIEGHYEDIDKGNNIDNGCHYIDNALHECFSIESCSSRESLSMSTEEKTIGQDQDYFDYLEEEVTEESEKIRQEMEARAREEKARKEQLHIIWLRKLRYAMHVAGSHIYGVCVYIRDGVVGACNYISNSLSNWYNGDSRNNNKAKAF